MNDAIHWISILGKLAIGIYLLLQLQLEFKLIGLVLIASAVKEYIIGWR